MIGKTNKTPQLNIFKTTLKHFINDSHELVLLSKSIDCDSLEERLSIFITLKTMGVQEFQ